MYAATNKSMDIVDEIQLLNVKVILNCAFGIDISETRYPFKQKGEIKQLTLAEMLDLLFKQLIERSLSPIPLLFPSMLKHLVLPGDKEIKENIRTVRNEILNVIRQKQELIKQNPSELEKGDLLSILLSDDLFKDNDKRLIDESLTFFSAGTQTSKSVLCTCIQHLTK